MLDDVKVQTHGISPKVVADAVTSVVAFVLAHFVIGIDPVAAAAISKAAGSVAAAIAGPGAVKLVPGGSDGV